MTVSDLFILVGGGIVVGFFFIGCEILYKRRQNSSLRKRQLALHYGRLWRQRSTSKKSTPRQSIDRFNNEFTPPPSGLPISASNQMLGSGWSNVIPHLRPVSETRFYLDEPEQQRFLPQSNTMTSIVWDRMEGPVQFELPQINETEEPHQDDTINSHSANYGAMPLPPLAQSSPHSQDERLAYRPRRAIIV